MKKQYIVIEDRKDWETRMQWKSAFAVLLILIGVGAIFFVFKFFDKDHIDSMMTALFIGFGALYGFFYFIAGNKIFKRHHKKLLIVFAIVFILFLIKVLNTSTIMGIFLSSFKLDNQQNVNPQTANYNTCSCYEICRQIYNSNFQSKIVTTGCQCDATVGMRNGIPYMEIRTIPRTEQCPKYDEEVQTKETKQSLLAKCVQTGGDWTNEVKSNNCYYTVHQQYPEDSSICEQINLQSERLRGICFVEVALFTQNDTLCSHGLGDQQYQNCLLPMAIATNNPALCDKIPDAVQVDDWHDKCVQSFST